MTRPPNSRSPGWRRGRIGGDNWGGVAPPSAVALAPHLGLGKEGDEVEVDGGLLPLRLPTAALPLPPHPSPWVLRSAAAGSLFFLPTHRFFSGVRFLPGDGSGAGCDAVARRILWAGREKVLDFFHSGTGAKLDTSHRRGLARDFS